MLEHQEQQVEGEEIPKHAENEKTKLDNMKSRSFLRTPIDKGFAITYKGIYTALFTTTMQRHS